jgi:hypothetical protein
MAIGLTSTSNLTDREPNPPISWQPLARYITGVNAVHLLATLPPQVPFPARLFRDDSHLQPAGTANASWQGGSVVV